MRVNPIPIVIAAAFLFGSTCDDSTTEPPVDTDKPSSHEWTWEYTIIDPPNTSGWLWDVCHINDTCIWAVGWIQHNGENYNACRWDGREWKLEQVLDRAPGSALDEVHQLYTVYGTDPNDIWFIKGTVFIHWDGNEYHTDNTLLAVLRDNGGMRTCWADSRTNIFAAGANGEIVHYNGHYWKRLENDIEWDIAAMHGNGDTVLVAATEMDFTGETAFYTIVGEDVQQFYHDSVARGVEALWFSHLADIYTDGPFAYRYDGDEWQLTNGWEEKGKGGFGRDMAANNHSDILVCGDLSTIRHYNGIDWRQLVRISGIASARFNGCTMRGDEAWVVGTLTEGTEVLIVKGTRSK